MSTPLEWHWDAVREAHYWFSQEQQCSVYQDGTRLDLDGIVCEESTSRYGVKHSLFSFTQ